MRFVQEMLLFFVLVEQLVVRLLKSKVLVREMILET